MASLKIVSDRLDDNTLKVAVCIPPRRNGEPNLACLTRLMNEVVLVNPDAFDPNDPPAPVLAHRDAHTADGGGIVAHDIAFAAIRDRVLATDDDVGAPGEPPRCKTGGCDE